LLQLLAEGGDQRLHLGLGKFREHADASDTFGLLGVGRQWQRNGHSAESQNELTPPHECPSPKVRPA
jgi:hypothetical protein